MTKATELFMLDAYLVGGAVRDELLGREVSDRDYVVVGATVQEMLDLGFTPVGSDFPVFLHPQTFEEYALARTERRSGVGYKGFVVHASPSVSLEEDLARRDLTINAMARTPHGTVIDPYGGQCDLKERVLRHVRASSFIEDPVRVLRLARFAARYVDFTVAAETIRLCQEMVKAGELDHLVPERVWKELGQGLREARPSRMFEVLRACGALKVLLPELDRLWGIPQPAAHHPEVDTGVHVMMVVDAAAAVEAPLEVRYACLLHDLGKGLTPSSVLPAHHGHEESGEPLVLEVSKRLKVPVEYRDLALRVCTEHTRVHRAKELTAGSAVKLFHRVDAFRRPQRLELLLQACELDAKGRLGFENRDYPQANLMRIAYKAAISVDAGKLAAACAKPEFIAERIMGARIRAVKEAWGQTSKNEVETLV